MNKRVFFILLFITTTMLSIRIDAQSNKTETSIDSISYYSSLANKLFREDSINAAFITINKVFELADSTENKELFGNLLSIKGYIYMNRGSSLKAIECFTRAKNIGSELNDYNMQISGYHGLGRVSINMDNNEKARFYLTEGLHLAEKHDKKRAEAILNNALGILSQNAKDSKESIRYFRKFYAISVELSDSLSILYATVNIGEAFLNIENLDSAVVYNKKAEALNLPINNAQAKASILGNYGRIAFLKCDYQSSIDLINRSMKISYDNDFSNFIIENYYLLIQDYQALGKVLDGINIYRKLDHYKDSLNKANNLKNIEVIQTQLILEEKTARALYWEQKYKNRNILLALLITISMLIIILLFLLLKRIKANKKKHSEETKSLNIELDEKNRELVTLVISGNQRKTVFDDLTKTIDSISLEKDINMVQNSLNKLKRDMSTNDQISNRWESFKVHFEKVHPNFFDALKKIQPNLTQSELRMCAYIKMNLTSKEIANLQNISTRSIQTNRYRIKKKLHLNSSINLISYIQAI